MNPVYDKLIRCYESFKAKINFLPQVALVLGSGLGDYAENIQIEAFLDYSEIDGFPVSTVTGHKGRFVFGHIGDVPVVIMQGRIHYYEGYDISDVVLPVRLMKLMGAKVLFLTNAAGGVNYFYKNGDFMMITDHISNFIPSPLIGENMDELGVRFPDMSNVYDTKLQEIIRSAADRLGILLQEGIYIQLTGPNLETPHEVKMCRNLGADATGMSTVCEAIAARHMGMEVCGISCITNLCAGMSEQLLTYEKDEKVQEMADHTAAAFKKLITEVIINIDKSCI